MDIEPLYRDGELVGWEKSTTSDSGPKTGMPDTKNRKPKRRRLRRRRPDSQNPDLGKKPGASSPDKPDRPLDSPASS